MFKRFQVTDLFHGDKSLDVKEWVDVEKELPEERSGIYKVKIKNGNEIAAYFYADKISGLMNFYKDESSYWWNKQTKDPLYDVTHWGR